MPYLTSAQSFLEQSTLLISARPTTTRITTTYNIPHPSPPPTKYKPTSLRPTKPVEEVTASEGASRARSLQPTLTLKTYDTASGTCLKYRTDKAAEVGRLVQCLGRCGRVMAALPLEDDKEEAKTGGMEGIKQEGIKQEGIKQEELSEAPMEGKPVQKHGQEQEKGKLGGSEGGGGGKKKKKGKR